MSETSKKMAKFYNYPDTDKLEIPYKSPKPPTNPIVRGLALHYGGSLISSLSFLQSFLWSNAGFDSLRGRKELENVSARYDPTVIPIPDRSDVDAAVEIYTALENVRPPRQPRGSGSAYSTVLDYHEAYKSGKLTPTAVVEALLPLIQRDTSKPSKHATAFVAVQEQLVRRAAEASTARYKEGRPLGVLDGVPVAVKDEVDVSGYKKRVGSNRDFSDKLDRTSWCVAKWEEEGAVLVGKTCMHELGMDVTNNNPFSGTTLNPHNPHYYTGGSSGGSGYAVGAGLVPIALGADGGGSIRIPSNFCGIFGLKPSHGRVSGRPTVGLATSTGVLGPMACTMTDLELAYRVMARPDADNPSSGLFPPPRRLTGGQDGAERTAKVLGVFKDWFDRADEPVRKACQAAIDYLVAEHGYTTVPISIPLLHEGQTAHALTILSEAASTVPDVTGLTAANKVLLTVARKTPSVDFLLAQRVRNVLMRHLASLFVQHPGLVIVTPTTPNAGFHISGGAKDLAYGISDGNMTMRTMEYVWLANLAGCPALSFPVGYVDPVEGERRIPVGLMGMGEWGSEDELIEFGFDGEDWLHNGLKGGRSMPETWVDVIGMSKQSA